MRIGIVTTWFERGAAYVSRQYRDVLRKDHEVFVYARGGERMATDDTTWNDSRVTWGERSWGKDFRDETRKKNLEHFASWITTNNIECVFFNEEHWWEPVLWCKEHGVVTGAYIDYYTRETMPFFAMYDFLVCNTRRHRDAFLWHPQVVYIPWGTDTDLFAPKNTGIVDPGHMTFFHSAGMSPERKGTLFLLDAFSRLDNDRARLVIHSQRPLAGALPERADLIRALETQGCLTCIEKTVSAPGLYYLGDVYVYPALLDGIGLTVAEALASGLPVITGNSAPMNEFVTETNGMLVDIKKCYPRDDGYYWPMCEVDVDDLCRAMKAACDRIDTLASWKRTAREYAEQHLDWKKNAVGLSQSFDGAVRRGTFPVTPHVVSSVRAFERMKQSRVRRVFHKVKLLGPRIVPFMFRWIKKYLYE